MGCLFLILGMLGYFSVAQRQELELQALIFRYMIAGAAVPPELLHLIKKSLLSSNNTPFFLHHPLQHFPQYPTSCKSPFLKLLFYLLKSFQISCKYTATHLIKKKNEKWKLWVLCHVWSLILKRFYINYFCLFERLMSCFDQDKLIETCNTLINVCIYTYIF